LQTAKSQSQGIAITLQEGAEGETMEAAQNDRTIKIGKMIFYITCAVSIWFFYWFAGIQCPC
jgi:hypothetical protein